MDNMNIVRKDAHDLVCVELDVHLWSGRKRLRKEALIEKNPALGELPPESLATLGAIKICDPGDLAPFAKLKRSAEKLLSGRGLPFLGSWGIPQHKVQSVYEELEKMKAEFNAARARLERDFTARIQDWRDKPENEDWAHLIVEVPTPEHVAGRMSFGFHMVRVTAPSSDECDPVNESYKQQVGGLKGELFADAAREARFLMDRCLTGKNEKTGVVAPRDKITHKTLRPLRRIAEKMRSFAFLDSNVLPMAQVIEHCLSLMPSEGPIEGPHLVHIWTLARTLSNEHAAEEAAMLAQHIGSADEAFQDLLAKTAEVQQSVAVQQVDPATADSDTPSSPAPATSVMEEPVAVPPPPQTFSDWQEAFF